MTEPALMTALISACVAVIGNGIFNIYIKKREFQNAFYSEVIKNRIAAHQEVSVLINDFWKSTEVNGEQCPSIIFYGFEDIRPYCDNIRQATQKNKVWITPGCYDALQRMYKTLNELKERDLVMNDHPEDIRNISRKFREILLNVQWEINKNFVSIQEPKKFMQSKRFDDTYQELLSNMK